MLLLILILPIGVTFSTPTGVYTNYPPGAKAASHWVVSCGLEAEPSTELDTPRLTAASLQIRISNVP
jgi:hypothetical protein